LNIQFGSGVLYGNPVAGNQPANPTPFKFGVLQEVIVDFKGDLKKLFGQYQLAVATARGKIETTIKGKLAVFDVNMLNQLYFGQPAANVTQGYNLIVDGEAHNNTTAVVTNTPIVADWGVVDAVTGADYLNQPNLAAVVTTGEYSVNLTSGTYTFNSNVSVKISYSYFNNTNTGTTVVLANQLMGYAPELKMLLYNKFRNKYLAVQLNDVTLGSISIPTKLEDFWISDFDGSANADATNTLGQLMMDNF
jgi:hypothetical protein